MKPWPRRLALLLSLGILPAAAIFTAGLMLGRAQGYGQASRQFEKDTQEALAFILGADWVKVKIDTMEPAGKRHFPFMGSGTVEVSRKAGRATCSVSFPFIDEQTTRRIEQVIAATRQGRKPPPGRGNPVFHWVEPVVPSFVDALAAALLHGASPCLEREPHDAGAAGALFVMEGTNITISAGKGGITRAWVKGNTYPTDYPLQLRVLGSRIERAVAQFDREWEWVDAQCYWVRRQPAAPGTPKAKPAPRPGTRGR